MVQLRRIGDVLLCTPAVRALRVSCPESYIVFLTEKESSDLLALNPYLDELIVLERERYQNPFYSFRKMWEIRKRSFDLAIDFMGNPRSAYISLFSGAKRRVGHDLHFRRLFYNLVVKDDGVPKYAAVHKLQVLRRLGWQSQDLKLDFFIPEEAEASAERFFKENGLEESKFTISISPTSRRRFRRWPLNRFAQLADWLISEFRANVILVWGPDEKEVVEEVKSLMREKPAVSQETRSLFQLGAMLKRCDLHIGNDNGTKHIAVAMGKPTITVFGPEDPTNWTYPDPCRHKVLKSDMDCPDCDKIKDKCHELSCLDLITVEEVQGVFLKLLKDLQEIEERGIAEKIERLTVDQRRVV